MTEHDLIRDLAEKNNTKIVMLVADGLGGLPTEPGGKTELETAATPNLDRLAAIGTSGFDPSEGYKGLLSNLKMWNRAFSADEVMLDKPALRLAV